MKHLPHHSLNISPVQRDYPPALARFGFIHMFNWCEWGCLEDLKPKTKEQKYKEWIKPLFIWSNLTMSGYLACLQ